MSGGSQRQLLYVPFYDSGLIPGGAAFDSGPIEFPWVQNVYAYLDNRSATTTRVLTCYFMRSDGAYLTNTATVSGLPGVVTQLSVALFEYSVSAKIKFQIAAAGADSARVFIRCHTGPR